MPFENFREQVSNSPVLKERFERVYNHVADGVESQTGVRPSRDDIIPMNCVRLSVFADSDDYLAFKDEMVLIPSVEKIRSRERLIEALESDGDSPAARALSKQLESLSGPEKIAFARANKLTEKQAEKKVELSDSELAKLVKQARALPLGMRMAFCRKHGLN